MVKLGTKAETLGRLQGELSNAEVLPLVYFTAGEWKENSESVWGRVSSGLPGDVFIVRSSALDEDTASGSQAGKFESVSGVSGKSSFFNAVATVLGSYGDSNPGNQVLVQPVLGDVKICGVAFTADPNTLGNYYVINYDKTGSTSSVTSGTSGDSRLLYVFKGRVSDGLEDGMDRVCQALVELENLCGQDNLDVEFAIDGNGRLFILQVRTLCLKAGIAGYTRQEQALVLAEKKIREAQQPKPFLCGDRTIYGVMPDWNPAEMIGVRPKPLALSLYRELITDSIWAYQRDNYGYRNLRSFPLMVSFCGLPYIDIRVSFNSFIPAGLDEKISEKLVNYYISCLESDPSKHDKVEFDIVFSCYTLDLPQRAGILEKHGFTKDEVKQVLDALKNLTNNIIDHETGLWRKDYDKIKILEKRYGSIVSSSMPDIEKIYWLVEDCKRYGTLPFAGLARAAFIAVQMLQSMVTQGIISDDGYQQFMNGVSTVSSNMGRDFVLLSKENFLDKYGHLRPGTYDINSKRYDEAPGLYFDWDSRGTLDGVDGKDSSVFRMSLGQMHQLEKALEENGLNSNVLRLMDFIKGAIESREYGKFVFTRSLSRVIQMAGSLGRAYGIKEEDFAYVSIKTVQEMYVSVKDMGDVFRDAVASGKREYSLTESVTLPPLILRPSDVWYFYYPDTEPNYITLGSASGSTVVLEGEGTYGDISGKIVLIPSADPGYDWIFSHGIKGFITMYGGANSHMAIRAGELGVPAVVGTGGKKFSEYRAAPVLEIDCTAKVVRIVRKEKKLI